MEGKGRGVPMLYRSPVTRWILAAGGILGGLLFTLGDGAKWRSTPSLHWLARCGVPLQVWGVVAVVYGFMLLNARTRPVGYAIGAALYAIFTVSLCATLGDGLPKNIWAIFGMGNCAVLHIYSIRTAIALRESA